MFICDRFLLPTGIKFDQDYALVDEKMLLLVAVGHRFYPHTWHFLTVSDTSESRESIRTVVLPVCKVVYMHVIDVTILPWYLPTALLLCVMLALC